MRKFENPELQKEYELEKARELARADMAVENDDVRKKNRDMNQKLFMYTIFPYIFMTCFILILEAISVLK